MQPLLPPSGSPNPYQEALDQLVVEHFAVTPATIPVCTLNESVSVDWQVAGDGKAPSGEQGPVRFTLQVGAQSFAVGSAGAQSVQITSPVTVVFFVEYVGSEGVVAARTLRLENIAGVPSPNSQPFTYTPELLAEIADSNVESAVAGHLAGYDLSLSGNPAWAIDPSGIHIRLKLALQTGIPGIDILDIDVNVTVIPFPDQGQFGLAFASDSIEARFPWWAWLTAAVWVAQVELLINNVVIPLFQSQVVTSIKQALNNLSPPIPPGVTIAQVQLEDGRMIVTACLPSGCIPQLKMTRLRAHAASRRMLPRRP
jgi:hypothetical protein